MKLRGSWTRAITVALAMLGAFAAATAQQLTGPAPAEREKPAAEQAPDREDKTPAEPGIDGDAAAQQEPRRPETPPQLRVRFDANSTDIDAAIDAIVADMPLAEKIGQLCQIPPDGPAMTPTMRAAIRAGEVGSILNPPNRVYVEEAQRIARDQSPHGIPLLIGRDVIHGYRTVFPIPLGQAASWNPELVERAAAVAAAEAQSEGINWTFAPMVDVCRDPRWGRIAETLGEDPLLASDLAAAMVRGFQQEAGDSIHGLVACVKHFAAYGLAEGGRDYNRASVSQLDLHNVYLPPFKATIDAGCRTLMTTFSEVNGVPGTAHEYLLQEVLRDLWGFRGFVVSDWNSVIEMIAHGFSADETDAARQAILAGVDMEMVSPTYHKHLATLVERGVVPESAIDDAVRRILRVKLELAWASDSGDASDASKGGKRHGVSRPRSLELARRLSRESIVLLKNSEQTLPLNRDPLRRIAVIGSLADDAKSQLGCWSLDGDANETVTALEAIRNAVGESAEVIYARGASADFSSDVSGLKEAAEVAAGADVAIMFVGEDALLSGEARSRADIALPGVQSELVRAITSTGTPTVMVVLAGRPLTIGAECELADAVFYAWHPGTMGGPAIADLLFGAAMPSGKLPVTFPKSVGQIPLYYGHTNTGRPSPKTYTPLSRTGQKDLPVDLQYRSHYLDNDPLPLFPFGYGLSYTTFHYDELQIGSSTISPGQTLSVTARVINTGERAGTEIVQLYVRDLVASQVRPVKELKAFRRLYLRPGEVQIVEFALNADDLAYLDADGKPVLEPGEFAIGIGGDSSVELNGLVELRTGASLQPSAPESVARRPAASEKQKGAHAE